MHNTMKDCIYAARQGMMAYNSNTMSNREYSCQQLINYEILHNIISGFSNHKTTFTYIVQQLSYEFQEQWYIKIIIVYTLVYDNTTCIRITNFSSSVNFSLLPGRVTDQRLKCANISYVAHLLHH